MVDTLKLMKKALANERDRVDRELLRQGLQEILRLRTIIADYEGADWLPDSDG